MHESNARRSNEQGTEIRKGIDWVLRALVVLATMVVLARHVDCQEISFIQNLPRIDREFAATYTYNSTDRLNLMPSVFEESVTIAVGTDTLNNLLLCTLPVKEKGFGAAQITTAFMDPDARGVSYSAIHRRGRLLFVASGSDLARFVFRKKRWVRDRFVTLPRAVVGIEEAADGSLFAHLTRWNPGILTQRQTFAGVFVDTNLSVGAFVGADAGRSATGLLGGPRVTTLLGANRVAIAREFDADVLVTTANGEIDTIRVFPNVLDDSTSRQLYSMADSSNKLLMSLFAASASEYREQFSTVKSLIRFDDSTAIVLGVAMIPEKRGAFANRQSRTYTILRVPQSGKPFILRTVALEGVDSTDQMRDVLRFLPLGVCTKNGILVEAMLGDVEVSKNYTIPTFLKLADERASLDRFTFRVTGRKIREFIR